VDLDMSNSLTKKEIVSAFVSLILTIVGVYAAWSLIDRNIINKPKPNSRTSLGEKILIPAVNNSHKEAGVKAFASGDFDLAYAQFEFALKQNPNDPESLIYQNNARIGNQSAVTIAVSIPIGSQLNVAQEILRGVAQAQTEINQNGGINGKLLKVKIANDDNQPEIAKELATEFSKDPEIMAVVGHNASNASVAACPIYDRNQLVMISPTSFSQKLSDCGESIFRTVPNIRLVADRLAEYIIKTARKKSIAICVDKDAIDNTAFVAELQSTIYTNGGKLTKFDCNLAAQDFNPNTAISQAISAGADSLVLAPHVDRINLAVEVAQANQGKLTLFGSPTLYTYQTVEFGQNNVNGMVLAAPWHPQAIPGSKFPQQAQKRWGGVVNWRTAMGYDATQVIITGLKRANTRQELQKVLSNPNFSLSGATGKIEFLPSGDRNSQAYLLKVQPYSQGYKFVPLFNPNSTSKTVPPNK
jgi:branched-chain amino acid transport system substrate-binding protein